MTTADLLARKRDGRELSPDEILRLVKGFVEGEVADYQMSAWLMAAYIRGLSDAETAALTHATAASGETLDLSPLPEPHVDKHSTGGVGDKTSLVLVPLLAACGCTVVKMSGRGLGITGGTVDKLESIPGFRTRLEPEEMLAVAGRVGCCIVGQSARIAPADGLIYALRDVTATVDSIPLITASILSKKLAAGADVISLDVKCGSGSFMPSLDRARELARSLVSAGRAAGKRTAACITDMSAPLGRAVGNALEVAEAIDTLSGRGEARFVELCLELAGETLTTAGVAADRAEGRELARRRLESGAARERFARLLEAQGADPAPADMPARLRAGLSPREVPAPKDGVIAAIDAGAVGQAVLELGAGRRTKEDSVDPAVGVEFPAGIGASVRKGNPLALVYARDEAGYGQARAALLSAIRVGDAPIEPPPLILDRVP